jgi:hypothetical protein
MVELDTPDFVSSEVVTRVVAHDPAGVLRVDLFLDEMRVGAAEFAPFDITWDASRFDEGPHELRALAYASDDRTGEAIEQVTVDLTLPDMVVPSSASRDEPFLIHATDELAGVASVLVLRGDTTLAVLDEPPFQFDWPGGCGAIPLRIVARDLAGNEAEEEVTVLADDFQDVDCDGSIASMFDGPDCDDSRAEINPDAEDTATSVVDRNCDGVPGVDADGDGVPSLATQGTDCDDSDPGVTGSWPGWTGVPMRFTGIDAGVAGVAMAEADGRLEMVFTAYDGGLYHGETALDETASELVVPAELIASGVVVHSEPSPNLLLFANGDAAVAFRRDGAPAVAVRRAGGPWAITVVDPDLGYGRVALAGTSADDLHVVYEPYGSNPRYATNATGTWAFEPLPDSRSATEAPQIAVNAQGLPHILFETSTEFRLAVRQDGLWTSALLWPDRNQVRRYSFAPRGPGEGLLLAATMIEPGGDRMAWAHEGLSFTLVPFTTTLPGVSSTLSVWRFEEFIVDTFSSSGSQATLGFHGSVAQQIGPSLVARAASPTSFHSLVEGPDGGYWLGSSRPIEASGCFAAQVARSRQSTRR